MSLYEEERATSASPRPPAVRIAAVVLAAGLSRRMGAANKLLIPGIGAGTMIGTVVDNVLASAARPILVVCGHQADQVEKVLVGRPVHIVLAADYASGLAASLRAGICAVPGECSAAVVCLGDMPLVKGSTIDRLLAAYDPGAHRSIVTPSFHGARGNPILWDRRYFPEIMALSGDVGARRLLVAHKAEVAAIEVADEGVLRDFDTPEALATEARF